jgi:hypothetical protein
MLLLGRGANARNISYYYCLVAVQLLRIYCTISAWSRFDYSMLLLGRGATASNILLLLLGRASIIVCYCLAAVQLLEIYRTIIA